MLERFLLGYWNFVRVKIVWFLVLAMILVGVFGYGATKVGNLSTIEGNLEKDSTEYKALKDLWENFSYQSMIVLVKGDNLEELLSDQNLAAMKYITDKGDDYDEVLFALSPEYFIRTLKEYGQIPADTPSAEAVLDENGQISATFANFLPDPQNAPDGKQCALVPIGLWTKIDTERTHDLIKEYKVIMADAGFDSNVEPILTGFPLFMDYTGYETPKVLNRLMGIGVLIMLVTLALFFRVSGRVVRRWIPLAMVLVSIIYTFGIMGFVDIPLTSMSMVAFPILLGMSVDSCVQTQNRYDEEIRKGKTADESARTTIRRVVKALWIGMTLQIVGFCSVFLVGSPQVAYFGSALIIGCAICMVVMLMVVTGILYRLDKGGDGKRKPNLLPPGPVERFLAGMVPFLAKYGLLIIVISIIVSGIGWYYEDDIEVATGFVGAMRDSQEEFVNIRYMQALSGGVSPLDVVVTADNVLEPDILQWTLDKSNELKARWGLDAGGYVGSVDSVASMFAANFGGLPATAEQAEMYLGMMSEPMWINLVREDRTALHISIINSSGDNVPIQQTIDIMDEIFVNPPAGSEAVITGLSFVAPAAANLLDETRDKIMLYGVGFTLIAMFLFFRLNIRRVIAAAFPVVLVFGWGSLYMYMSDMYVSTLMALLPAQMMAVGIELTIILLMRYYEERDKGEHPILAMTTALSRVGRAILISGSMVVFGFGILMFAFQFPSVQDFGIVTVIDMVLIIVSCLVVLPAVVLTFDLKWRKYKFEAAPPVEEILAEG